jgi:hypothetical protein
MHTRKIHPHYAASRFILEKKIPSIADRVYKLFSKIWMGIGMGAATSLDLAFASGAKPLSFRASASSVRSNPQGSGVEARLTGSAQVYPNGKIFITYQLAVDLFLGNKPYTPCGMHVNILFNLVDKNGCVLESFTENRVKGSKEVNKTYTLDEKIVSRVDKINVYINLVD